MLKKTMMPVWCSVLFLLLGGCAQFDAWTDTSLKRKDAAAAAASANTPAHTLYVNPDAPVGVADFRTVYIAPANLANMQVIQPEGALADPEWWVTEEEDAVLQRAIAYEFSVALTTQSDFTIVTDRAQAQLVINTAVVAVHPNETRASVAKGANPAKGARPSGSITVSVAVVNAASGEVLVRSVDTRASDDIWVLNQVKRDDPVANQVFATWGADIRSGILQLQGRPEQSLVSNPQL